jgi:hypothetical protein
VPRCVIEDASDASCSEPGLKVVLFRVYVTACSKDSSISDQERRVNVAQVLRRRFMIQVLFPELLYRMAWTLYVYASLFVGEVVGGR